MLTTIGCSRQPASVGIGVGVVYQVDPETKRNIALSSWYTSSSTSSTTLSKEEFISSTAIDFIRNRYEIIAEESAKGHGNHLNALAKLISPPSKNHPELATFLRRNYYNLFHVQSLSPTTLGLLLKAASFPNIQNLP